MLLVYASAPLQTSDISLLSEPDALLPFDLGDLPFWSLFRIIRIAFFQRCFPESEMITLS